MCDGCSHKATCKALGITDFMPKDGEASPCFEAPVEAVAFDTLRKARDVTLVRYASREGRTRPVGFTR